MSEGQEERARVTGPVPAHVPAVALFALVLLAALLGRPGGSPVPPDPRPDAVAPAPTHETEVRALHRPSDAASDEPGPAERRRPGVSLDDLERTVFGRGTLAEKNAALKAAYKSDAVELLSRILTSDAVDPELRPFALAILEKNARTDPKACEALSTFALSGPTGDPMRHSALCMTIRWGGPTEIERATDRLLLERDPLDAAFALAANGSEAARLALGVLATHHPNDGIRHRAHEFASGEYCSQHAPEEREP